MKQVPRTFAKLTPLRLIVVSLLVCAILLQFLTPAYGDLLQRNLVLSDNRQSATSRYQLNFTLPSSQTLGSIQLQFCANNPLIGQPCTAPTGFDVSMATLSSQSGETGFSIDPATSPNNLILTRTAALANAGPVSYVLDGVINPSAPGSYYGRLQTFASTDASGSDNDHGGLAFQIGTSVQVSATVPPYLLYCVGIQITGYDCSTATGNYINFGTLSDTSTRSAETQMVTATNAGSGYAIRVSGTTLTSGNNVISALLPADVSRPGVNQFGLNLVQNATPSVGNNPQGPGLGTPAAGYDTPDFFRFSPGEVIAGSNTSDDFRKFTVSYIANIAKAQPVGVYVTTLSYVCLANF